MTLASKRFAPLATVPCDKDKALLTTKEGSTAVGATLAAKDWIAANISAALLLAGVTAPSVPMLPHTAQQLCISTARRLTKRELTGVFRFIFGIAY